MINSYGCFNPDYPIVDCFATVLLAEDEPRRIHILVQDMDQFFHAPPDADIPAISIDDNQNLWVKKDWLTEISFTE